MLGLMNAPSAVAIKIITKLTGLMMALESGLLINSMDAAAIAARVALRMIRYNVLIGLYF